MEVSHLEGKQHHKSSYQLVHYMKMTTSSFSLVSLVNRCEPELVVPAKPTPRELKPLSDIDDQEGLRFHVPIIMFFNNNPFMENTKDPVKIIREALGQALVPYYPLAGRLKEGPHRKLTVDCNGEGVMFIEADADVKLEQLGDAIQFPCPLLEELLRDVPGSEGIVDCPMLLIQVTRLACGGFIFAVRLNHTICDALGLAQFLNVIAEKARGAQAPIVQPVWQRELLNARNPPRITCTHNEFEDVVNEFEVSTDEAKMVNQSFFFGPKEITALRKQLPPHLHRCTTFELLTACLWKCRTTALEFDPHEEVRISSLVNARGKRLNLGLPSGYYGNAFAYPAAVTKAELLCKNPLGYAVELVKKAKGEMSEEYIRSVADLMVIKGRPRYTTAGNFIVADNTRTGAGEVDFGWGKPVYAGPAKAFFPISFYVQYRNKGEDGTVVLICLPSLVMERFYQLLKTMTKEPAHNSSYNESAVE